MGVQCFNVATAYTAWRAIAYGEPVLSRIVTVTGNVEQPRNWEILLGTPLKDTLALAQPKSNTDRYLMGGPMMGFEMPSVEAPIVKASNCIIAGSTELFPPVATEMPCIRCGSCAEACPHELQPFEMYWFSRAKNFGKAQEYSLFDCIECGCCSYVCPSRIRLVQYFRFAKSEIWSREREKNMADAAKARFERRNERDEREKAEKAARLAKAAAAKAVDAKADSIENPGIAADADSAKKAAIAAAMERARQQRENIQPKNTDSLTDDQRRTIAEIEVRRAPLQAQQAAVGVAKTESQESPREEQ